VHIVFHTAEELRRNIWPRRNIRLRRNIWPPLNTSASADANLALFLSSCRRAGRVLQKSPQPGNDLVSPDACKNFDHATITLARSVLISIVAAVALHGITTPTQYSGHSGYSCNEARLVPIEMVLLVSIDVYCEKPNAYSIQSVLTADFRIVYCRIHPSETDDSQQT
jgi:hypothetical protein